MISANNAKNDLEGVRLKSAKFSEYNSADESDYNELAWMMLVRELTLLSYPKDMARRSRRKGEWTIWMDDIRTTCTRQGRRVVRMGCLKF